jgi:hypothetical protein
MRNKNKSAMRMMRPLNDFQVFKGRCEKTMEAFGAPVMVHHEAQLMVRNDQALAAAGTTAMYAIYKRSENRILQIVKAAETAALPLAA